MKYLVMECHAGYVILLDEEGRFLRAVNRGYQVGETIVTPMLLSDGKHRIRPAAKLRSAAILIAACLLLIFGFGVYQTQFTCYTAIHLTVNPDIRIELSRKGRVLKVVGLNEDGEALIEDYEYRGKDRRILIEELITRAVDMGYLNDGDTVILDIDTANKEASAEYADEIKARIDHALDGKMNVSVQVVGSNTLPPADTDPEGSSSDSNEESKDPSESDTNAPAQLLSKEEILAAILHDLGLTRNQITVEEFDLDDDNGRRIYDLEFYSEQTEYEYKIDAYTAEILEHHQEPRSD